MGITNGLPYNQQIQLHYTIYIGEYGVSWVPTNRTVWYHIPEYNTFIGLRQIVLTFRL
jgi:hypothetical protein